MTPEELLRDEKFTATWGEYLAWRKTMGKRFVVTDRVIKCGLQTLAEMGSVEVAIRSLEHCMFAGYRGIFRAPDVRPPARTFGQIPDAPPRFAAKPQPARGATATPQEESALADYKAQAEHMSPAERSDLMTKARDVLPAHLVGQLAARVAILNARRGNNPNQQRTT